MEETVEAGVEAPELTFLLLVSIPAGTLVSIGFLETKSLYALKSFNFFSASDPGPPAAAFASAAVLPTDHIEVDLDIDIEEADIIEEFLKMWCEKND